MFAMLNALSVGLAPNPMASQERVRLCASALAALGLAVLAMPVQAQSTQTRQDLLPLTSQTLSVPNQSAELAQISEMLNAQMVRDRQPDENHLQIDSLPIIGDLVDEAGNLDMGINLPFDMSISDVMGETGLVLRTDFTVN